MQSTRGTAISNAAREIHAALKTRGQLTTAEAKKFLNAAFADEETAWEAGDGNEACELGVTRLLLESAARGPAAQNRAERDAIIEGLSRGEPRIPKRSERHDRLQHYATPIDVAWAMVLAAGIDGTCRVIDPSAGTGTLLAMAGLASGARAELQANEADGLRADMLAAMAPEINVIQGDALTLERDAPQLQGTYDVVLMNPPFSARLGSGGRHRNEDLRHLTAAAGLLAPTGRITALLGGGGRPRDAKWDKAVSGRLRLRWLTSLDGRLMRSRLMNVSTWLCVLENGPEDDAVDPITDAETYSDPTILRAARPGNARTTRESSAKKPIGIGRPATKQVNTQGTEERMTGRQRIGRRFRAWREARRCPEHQPAGNLRCGRRRGHKGPCRDGIYLFTSNAVWLDSSPTDPGGELIWSRNAADDEAR